MNYLKQKLEEKHMTQKELAIRTGISRRTLEHYIYGNVLLKNVKINTIYNIATALDLDLKEFIEEILK